MKEKKKERKNEVRKKLERRNLKRKKAINNKAGKKARKLEKSNI